VKYTILIGLLFFETALAHQPAGVKMGGGPIPKNPRNCISDYERSLVRQNKINVDSSVMRDTLLFQDPYGNRGMININDSVRHYITNYVDKNNISGQTLDYYCNSITYDGHNGTDIGIGGFYFMDEMKTPILAVAPGIVSYTNDGEFDRYTYWNFNSIANAVVVTHSDGSSTWYWHMKKNSVAVSVGDTVVSGDTLGFVGSSGISDGPHLHFEVQDQQGQIIDPWAGPCNNVSSQWEDQLEYTADTSVHEPKLIDQTTTSYPGQNGNWDEFWNLWAENIPSMKHINPGDQYRTSVFVRNLYRTDTLKTKWYLNNEFVDEWWWVPGESQWWTQGYEFYSQSFWYWYGSWDWMPMDPIGEWKEENYINSNLLGVRNFNCDDVPNQIPSVDMQQISVELGKTISGEFTVTDDGDPFWFNLVAGSNHGGHIDLSGGRRRKFTYTAPVDYVGFDPIRISATDDRNITGGPTMIFFEVTGSGITDFMVTPTYVSVLEDSVIISAEALGDQDQVSVFAHVKNIVDSVSYEPLELSLDGGLWFGSWVPPVESFFSVDLKMLIDDTTLYENIGAFTSVGPINLTTESELTANLGDVIVLEFGLTNNSTSRSVSDLSLSFQSENMDCIQNMSGQNYFFESISVGETAISNDSFVLVLNSECDSDTSIVIQGNIHSGGNLYWKDSISISIQTLNVEENNIPKYFSLGNAYPNPFNPNTTIQYGLSSMEFVTIEIYDLMGRKIKSLVNEKLDPGIYSSNWDATDNMNQPVSGGMYFYQMQAGDFKETKKIILIK